MTYTAKELVKKWEPRAKLCKTALQMMLGVLLPLTLALKAVLWLRPDLMSAQEPIARALAQSPTLKVVGGVLLVSTAIDLAYMLFTPGPDEAVEPVMTGFAATVLILLSQDQDKLNYLNITEIAALTAGIGFLFWVRHRFRLW